ncbi:MAG TPA: histidine kinase dimerization/phosphoacceptor domain -containing protein [Ignavibacteriaceae bacterium]|nr:histidine kinase dimerization/phosphoacceptor domain -containing protein [Ignavibacteriaceae bacterium]
MEHIKILILEDCEEDYLLLIHKLKEEGLSFEYKVVGTSVDYENALTEKWDIIIADYFLPSFSGLEALLLIKKLNLDIPFILVSGAIGEEQAVLIMKEGAADYLNKNNLKRLVPVILRELEDAKVRRNKKEADEKLLEAHKELEYRVRLRTEELRKINEQLSFEIKRKEEIEIALKKSLDEFETLANTPPNFIIKIDFENNKRFYNDRLYEYLGLNKEFKNKLDFNNIIHPDDDIQTKLKIALDTSNGEFKLRIKSASGEYRWFLIKYQNLFSSSGKITNLFLSATDVQDLLNAQEKVAEEERRFKIIQEVSPDGFALLKPFRDKDNVVIDFTLDYLNPAGLKLLNFTNEVIGKKAKELIPENLYWFLDECVNVLEKNVSKDVELLFDNGLVKFWVRDITVKIDDNVGLVFTDITKKKEAEKEKEELLSREQKARIFAENALKNLEQAKEEYSIMGETIPYGVWKTDADGRVVYTSKSFLDLLNMTLEEMQQFGWTKRLVPEDVEPMFRKWMYSIKTGRPWDHTHRIIDKNGKVNYVLSKGLPVKDKDGLTTGWVGLNLDITDKMEVEKELEKTRGRLNEVLLRIDDIIIAVDNDFKINFINSSALNFINNLSESEILGKNFFELFPVFKNTIYDKHLNMAVADQRPTTFEYFINEYKHWFLISIYPSKEGITIITKNVNERKRQEENLKTSLKEKEFLLREIHHRIKNNLQIVSSLLSLQANYITDPKAIECFMESQNRIRSMAIVHEQLYKSRQISSVSIKDYIKELCNTLLTTYKSEILADINFKIEEDMLSIDDAINIGLIVNELVLNCIKHAFKGKIKGEVNIVFHLTEEDKAYLEVKDNGIGFPKHIDIRNTESFGLQLVTAMVDQMAGNVKCVNDNGCIFKIELKIKNSNIPKDIEETTAQS